MRALSACLVVALCSLAFAAAAEPPTKAERERKVKVALALSAAPPKSAAAADSSCGQCRTDIPEVWAESIKDKKPIALFVGGACKSGLGSTAHTAGAIAAKVDTYPSDGKGAETRVVLIKPTDGGMVVDATLPAKVTAKELTAAVQKATPPDAKPTHLPPVPRAAGEKLDWLVK